MLLSLTLSPLTSVCYICICGSTVYVSVFSLFVSLSVRSREMLSMGLEKDVCSDTMFKAGVEIMD